MFQDLEKKCQQLLGEKEQLKLKNELLTEESKTLRHDLTRSNKEKIVAQSKACEVEAKLSVHCKGKETCLKKIETIQNKLTELSKSKSILEISTHSLESRVDEAKIVQKKLKLLNLHSDCIIADLQKQIKEKNRTIVLLKAVHLKEPKQNTTIVSTAPLEEDKLLISTLQRKLAGKTDEIEKLQRLLHTTKESGQCLSQVFLVEREGFSKKLAESDLIVQKLQAETDMLRCCILEKEQENENIGLKFRVSSENASELQGEVNILKHMIISENTLQASNNTCVGTADNGCQGKWDVHNTAVESVDKSVECMLELQDQGCQTSYIPLVTSATSPTAPMSDESTKRGSCKRPLLASPIAYESTKRGRADQQFEFEPTTEISEDSSPSPLPLMKRLSLKAMSPISYKGNNLETGEDYGMIRSAPEQDTNNAVPNTSYIVYGDVEYDGIEGIEYTQVVTVEEQRTPEHLLNKNANKIEESVKELRTLEHLINKKPNKATVSADEPRTPEHLINVEEPRTPEHLINKDVDRVTEYHNDPDYSPVISSTSSDEDGNSSRQAPINAISHHKSPADRGDTRETLHQANIIKESPLANDSGIGDETASSSNTNNIYNVTLEECAVGVCDGKPAASSCKRNVSSSEEDEVAQLTPAVTDILNSAYDRVNAIIRQPAKHNFYKASLSKSPKHFVR